MVRKAELSWRIPKPDRTRPGAIVAASCGVAGGGGDFVDRPVYAREALRPGNRFAGPAIVEQMDATTLVPPGWTRAGRRVSQPHPRGGDMRGEVPPHHVRSARAARLEGSQPQRGCCPPFDAAPCGRSSSAEANGDGRPPETLDPITVEVIGAAMASIVEETGETLIRASHSTNIKERRDLLDGAVQRRRRRRAGGRAHPDPPRQPSGPHQAHHAALLRPRDIRPGDAFIGNDAYEGGGTHLPDIVIAEPIFVDGRMVAWTVNLAHHADFVDRGHAHIYQEGLRIPPVRLYRGGELQTTCRT